MILDIDIYMQNHQKMQIYSWLEKCPDFKSTMNDLAKFQHLGKDPKTNELDFN